jgi:hypothetical protein
MATLERIEQSDSDLAKDFDLKETDIVETPLRLICKHSFVQEADTAKLAMSPAFMSYLAVSYCCHNADRALTECLRQETFAGGRQGPISQRVFRALLELREDEDEA